MVTLKIDDSWELDMSSPINITLIELKPNDHPKAKSPVSRSVRGYYAHIDEALKAYARKSPYPCKTVEEYIMKMDQALENILKFKGRK